MRSLIIVSLYLLLAGAAFAGNKDDLRNAIKQQAGQRLEEEFGVPQPAPAGARATIISPTEGAEVSSPVKVLFGLSGMGVAPAGVNKEGTGHFHLLIDDPQVDYAKPLPSTDQVRHYGGGQIEASVELKPGKHTLQLLVADWKHMPNNPAVMSDKITVTVK